MIIIIYIIEQSISNLLMLNTYMDSMELHSEKEVNDRDPKFNVGDLVKISK